MKTMAPSGNPFQNSAIGGNWAGPSAQTPWGPSCHFEAVAQPTPANALALYNPNALFGAYYNGYVNGPLATGQQVNPFTPGLSPVSDLPKPAYAVTDPLRERYPASREAADPLNWISEDLFSISQQRAALTQQRASLRDLPARPAA